MATQKKNLVRFNVSRIVYFLPDDNGGFLPSQDLSTPIKVALENDFTIKKIYGGGKVIGTITNDKGKTGTLTTNNICDPYEIAMGRKIETKRGLADIQQRASVVHCIGFEIQSLADDGGLPLSRTILYNVTSSRPNESYDQTTDDINESSFETGIEIKGTPLLDDDGKVVKDAKGNDIIVWQETVDSGDAEFDTFFDNIIPPTKA